MRKVMLRVQEKKRQEAEMTEKNTTDPSCVTRLHFHAKECIRSLAGKILSGDIPLDFRLWSGAGVAVVYRRPHRPPKLKEWYPDPRFLETRHAPQVSWIFEELWKGFHTFLDSKSKARFYERLTDAALSCSGTPEEKRDGKFSLSRQNLLLAILVEAVLFEQDLRTSSPAPSSLSSGETADTDRKLHARPETFLERRRFLEQVLAEVHPSGKNAG